jgi:hypothetical protein
MAADAQRAAFQMKLEVEPPLLQEAGMASAIGA